MKVKSFFVYFILSLFFTVCLGEVFAQLTIGGRSKDYWNIRFRKEATAIEMYGEDIWKHGRRTLRTPFDPDSCSITSHVCWYVRWADVKCEAEDNFGQHWQYTNRYGITMTPMFGIPFLINAGPNREMKLIQYKP